MTTTDRIARALTCLLLSASALQAQTLASRRSASTSATAWKPLLAVHEAANNGEPIELSGLAGARISATGEVLFSDSKPVLVWSHKSGSRTSRLVARAGAGPGEFRAPPMFVAYLADSIAAYDGMLQRWSLLSPSGAFVRVIATGNEAAKIGTSAANMADGAIVLNASMDAARQPSPAVIRRVVGTMASSAAPVVIRQVESGDLWIAANFTSNSWTVFDSTGRKRADLKLAKPFRLMFANDTIALGESFDADDIPQLTTIQLRGMPKGVTTAAPATAAKDNTPERIASGKSLSTMLRRLVMSQESAYADSSKYTTNVLRLGVQLPEGVVLTIAEATGRGWFAIARDANTGVTCAMGVGLFLTPGWSEAKPYCSAGM